MNNGNPNVVLDFSAANSMNNLLNNQPLAIMPAAMAKKLLKMYQSNLTRRRPEDIINDHITDLKSAQGLNEAVDISTSWLIERDLIENVAKENWDAYKVEPEVQVH